MGKIIRKEKKNFGHSGDKAIISFPFSPDNGTKKKHIHLEDSNII